MTRSFIRTSSSLSRIHTLIEEGAPMTRLKPGECMIRLQYQRQSAAEAIVSTVSRQYGVNANIIFGNIELLGSDLLGELIVILSGGRESIESAIAYFQQNRVDVEVILDARAA